MVSEMRSLFKQVELRSAEWDRIQNIVNKFSYPLAPWGIHLFLQAFDCLSIPFSSWTFCWGSMCFFALSTKLGEGLLSVTHQTPAPLGLHAWRLLAG